jgi:hypothetical protein
LQNVAGSALVHVLEWRHIRTGAGFYTAALSLLRICLPYHNWLLAGRLHYRYGIRPRLIDVEGAVTIVAIHLHRASGATYRRLQMSVVIEADRARIGLARTKRGKFRVPAVKAGNVRVVQQRSIPSLEIAVTLRAARVGGLGEPVPSAVLHVTGTACRGEGLARSVSRSIVAGEAAVVGDGCAVTGAWRVAQGTLVSKSSVRCRHGAGAVEVRTMKYILSENPTQRDYWQRDRKNQSPAAKGTEPGKVLQVDAFGQRLGGAYAGHDQYLRA